MFDPTSLIETFGYIGLFCIVFFESGLLVGLVLPGDSLLFTAGFLASQGYLHIGIIIPMLFIAAFTGDSAGYFIGMKIGPKLFSRPKSFWFHPHHVEKTQEFFDHHGIKTIFLARFIPIVRSLAPMLAGIGKMNYRTFVIYNALGALAWAVGLTTLGYLFGNFIPNADHYIIPVVLSILIVSFIPPIWEILKEYRNRA